MKEADFQNITVEELLSSAEYMILCNPEMDGLELIDSEGRTWYLQLVEGRNTQIN